MVSRRSLPPALLAALPIVLPALTILFARAATFSDWAQSRPQLSALFFGWVVVDALALGLLAKAPNHKPTLYQVTAVLAVSSVVMIVGAAAPVRDIYLGLPQVVAAFGGTIAVFSSWSVWRFAAEYRRKEDVGSALEAFLPPLLFRFAAAESRMMRLALLSWGEHPDVPTGAKAFPYHTYLVPMIVALVVLQIIELAVVHFLVMLWKPIIAWILFVLSVWGILWTVALLKSFRMRPVLIESNEVRARSGLIYDVTIPFDAIEGWDVPFTKEELDGKSVLNLAILSSPNVSLRFNRELVLPTMFGGERLIEGVALRLDDSAAFVSHLESLKAPRK